MTPKVSLGPRGDSEREGEDLWFATKGGLLVGSGDQPVQRCYIGILASIFARRLESPTFGVRGKRSWVLLCEHCLDFHLNESIPFGAAAGRRGVGVVVPWACPFVNISHRDVCYTSILKLLWAHINRGSC